MKVRCYVHKSILREGLRDKLHLNPFLFEHDAEILANLAESLPEWRSLAQEHRPKQGMSLKPLIKHQRVSLPGGGDPGDERFPCCGCTVTGLLTISLDRYGKGSLLEAMDAALLADPKRPFDAATQEWHSIFFIQNLQRRTDCLS